MVIHVHPSGPSDSGGAAATLSAGSTPSADDSAS